LRPKALRLTERPGRLGQRLGEPLASGIALIVVGARQSGKSPCVVHALVAALAAELGDAALASDPADLGILAEQLLGLRVLLV
jgi:hypothetical protein